MGDLRSKGILDSEVRTFQFKRSVLFYYIKKHKECFNSLRTKYYHDIRELCFIASEPLVNLQPFMRKGCE